MKLQLNERTLNAYINEAIRQELNEALAPKSTSLVRTIEHSPITKKFFGRIKDAKSARKFIMGLRRGKVVSGTVESGKGAKGLNWFTKDGKTFFRDAACKQQITNPAELRAVSGSFKGHYTAAANLFNSAQRNMLGTAAVAGLGTGWAIDHNRNSSNPDDPWNGPDEPEEDNGGGDRNFPDNGWNGPFPWDDTDPVYPPSPQPQPAPAPSGDNDGQAQPVKRDVGPTLPNGNEMPALNGPTQAQSQQQTALTPHEPEIRFPQNVSRTMLQTAQEPATNASQREKNRALSQMKRNAINTINSDSYGASPAGKKNDKRDVRDAYRQIRRGDQNPNI